MNPNSEHSAKVAIGLLEIGAIKLSPDNPFTWTSGIKSPIYIDNRKALSYPKIRTIVTDALHDLINKQLPDAEAISGVATAGIPQGALVAAAAQLPFTYVRASEKGHGLKNRIEGDVKANQKIVVLEDLISTGGSAISAVDALRQANTNPIAVISIFNYGFSEAQLAFEQANIKALSVLYYDDLLKYAIESGYIAHHHLETLKQWRSDPKSWV